MPRRNKKARRNNRYPNKRISKPNFTARGRRPEYVTNGGLSVRSGLELKVCNQLEKEKIEFEYEPQRFEWYDYNPRARCGECGNKGTSYVVRTYTPDIKLPNGVWVEVKGRLTARDRKILLGVRDRNEELDLRIVFGPDNKLNKNSTTRYSDWAAKHNFICAFGGQVPIEWAT